MATKPIFTDAKAMAMSAAIDEVYGNILKLHALLANTYGDRGESFRNMADDMQDNYLWACSDIARQIESTLDASFKVPVSQSAAP